MASKRGSKSKSKASETASDSVDPIEVKDQVPTDAESEAKEAIEAAELVEETPAEDLAEASALEAEVEAESAEPEAETDAAHSDDAVTEDAEPSSDPVVEPAPAKRGGMSVLMGGAAAAVLGFVVAQIVPNGWPVTPDPAVTEALSSADAQLGAQTEALAGRIAALEAADISGDLAPLQDQIAALNTQVTEQFGALADRVAALEERPIVDLSTLDNSDAVEAELEKLRAEIAEASAAAQAQIDAARNEATLLEQNALDAAQAAARRASLSRVLAALDSGSPYAVTLAEFADVVGGDIPAGLSAGADSGVATLAALQADFPPLAREALSAIRRADEGGENTLSNFFQTQFGVRSLEPQEGDSPNAVLSRIEAAATEGRLTDALNEASALPETGQSILAPWLEAAQMRVDAFAAAEALTQTVTTN